MIYKVSKVNPESGDVIDSILVESPSHNQIIASCRGNVLPVSIEIVLIKSLEGLHQWIIKEGDTGCLTNFSN